MATLIVSAKLNDIDPQAWLADLLARIADTPISKLEQMLPWNWQPHGLKAKTEPAAFTRALACKAFGRRP